MRGRTARTLAAVGATALILGLMACTNGSNTEPTDTPVPDDELASLIEAAQAEGRVNWMGGPAPAAAEVLIDAFTEKYGIEVIFTRLTSAPIAQRLEAEAAAEAIETDVFSTVDEGFFMQMREQGVSVDITDQGLPAIEEYPADYILDDGAGAVISVGPDVVVWNTDLLPDFEFTGWDDLLLPEVKDELILVDPRSSQAWAGLWSVLMRDDRYGEEFLEAVREQGIRQIVDSAAPGAQLIGSGEGGVLVASATTNQLELIAQGAPIKQVTAENPAHVYLQYLNITTDAPHPNAARLFTNFIFSEEGQQVFNEAHHASSPLGALPGTVPLPDGIVIPSQEQIVEDLPRVLELLGLE